MTRLLALLLWPLRMMFTGIGIAGGTHRPLAALLALLCLASAAGADVTLHNGIVLPTNWPPQRTALYDRASATNLPLTYKYADPWYLLDSNLIPDPILVATGRQLFVDTFLVNVLDSNMDLMHHSATVHPLSPQLESNDFAPYHDAVWWDSTANHFRVWGKAGQAQRYTWTSSTRDLMTFTTPRVVKDEGAGKTRQPGAIILNPDPNLRTGAQKWIMVLYDANSGTNAALQDVGWSYSGDGNTWVYQGRATRGGPLAGYYLGTGDRFNLWHDRTRNKYVALRGMYETIGFRNDQGPLTGAWIAEPNYAKPFAGADGNYRLWQTVKRFGTYYVKILDEGNEDPNEPGQTTWLAMTQDANPYIRACGWTEGNTIGEAMVWYGYRWNQAWACADGNDVAFNDAAAGRLVGLYAATPANYESITLVALGLYDGQTGGHKHAVRTHMAYSRVGGFLYSRPADRTPFLGLAPDGDANTTWNFTLALTANPFYHAYGDLYYIPVCGGNWQTRVRMGLATLRRDGFASMDSNASESQLTTKPILVPADANYLFINAQVDYGGSLYVEICGATGEANEGVTRFDCKAVTGDSTRHRVMFSGLTSTEINAFAGKRQVLRIYATKTKIYSFWFAPTVAGASGGYTNEWPGPPMPPARRF